MTKKERERIARLKQIGLKFKIERVKRNLTIKDLSKLAKVSVTTICRVENGEQVSRDITMSRLASALDIDIKELLCEKL